MSGKAYSPWLIRAQDIAITLRRNRLSVFRLAPIPSLRDAESTVGLSRLFIAMTPEVEYGLPHTPPVDRPQKQEAQVGPLRLLPEVIVELNPPLPPIDVVRAGRIVGPAAGSIHRESIGDVVDDQRHRGLLVELVANARVEQRVGRAISRLVELWDSAISDAVDRCRPCIEAPAE